MYVYIFPQTITDAVITVPASFTTRQREEILKAGQMAGINVLRLVHKPTAAAIYYGFHKDLTEPKKVTKPKNLFVLELGGGTFDVSVIQVTEDEYTTLSIHGGKDFDKMVDHFIKYFNKEYDINISHNQEALHNLRDSCQRAKIYLISNTEVRQELVS